MGDGIRNGNGCQFVMTIERLRTETINIIHKRKSMTDGSDRIGVAIIAYGGGNDEIWMLTHAVAIT